MEEKTFRTVVIPSVDGEVPSWYDPNWSPEDAVIHIHGKPKIVANLSVLSKIKAAAGNDTEALYSALANFNLDPGDSEANMFPRNIQQASEGVSLGDNVKFGFSGLKRAQQAIQNSSGSVAQEARPANVTPPPSVAVDIAVSGAKFKLQCFYHEVVISEPYLILIFNIESIGFPKFFPDPGAVLSVSIPKFNIKDLALVSTGIKFTHNSHEYCVLVDYDSVHPQDEEQKVEVKEDQENLLDQLEK